MIHHTYKQSKASSSKQSSNLPTARGARQVSEGGRGAEVILQITSCSFTHMNSPNTMLKSCLVQFQVKFPQQSLALWFQK